MGISDALILIAAGIGAGVLSTAASAASVLSYPVLLALGLTPLAANVTNTMSLVLTSAGSVLGSRQELSGQCRRVLRLGAMMALGGGAGAALLLLAPPGAFTVVVPVLVAGSSLALLVQPRIKRLRAVPGGEGAPGRRAGLVGAGAYIGYFGAAGGVLLLAVLAAMVDDSLIRLNAVKNVIAGFANAVAAVAFTLWAPVHWVYVPPLAAGFMFGGFLGPHLVRRLPGEGLRSVIALCGLGLAVKLGMSAYR